MAYVDYSAHWSLDNFFTFLEANQLGANSKHIVDNFSVEHTWNATTADGTHKANSILGSYINKIAVTDTFQDISNGSTWTPSAGVYIFSLDDSYNNGSQTIDIQVYMSGAWKKATVFYGVSLAPPFGSDMVFCDGTNVRLLASVANCRVYYQKF